MTITDILFVFTVILLVFLVPALVLEVFIIAVQHLCKPRPMATRTTRRTK